MSELQRGLARARRTDEGDQLARLDAGGDALQDRSPCSSDSGPPPLASSEASETSLAAG